MALLLWQQCPGSFPTSTLAVLAPPAARAHLPKGLCCCFKTMKSANQPTHGSAQAHAPSRLCACINSGAIPLHAGARMRQGRSGGGCTITRMRYAPAPSHQRRARTRRQACRTARGWPQARSSIRSARASNRLGAPGRLGPWEHRLGEPFLPARLKMGLKTDNLMPLVEAREARGGSAGGGGRKAAGASTAAGSTPPPPAAARL